MACSTEKKQHKTDINGLYFNFKTVSDDRVEKWNGLTLAVDHTLTDLITQLFEKGADPNVRTSNNKTALGKLFDRIYWLAYKQFCFNPKMQGAGSARHSDVVFCALLKKIFRQPMPLEYGSTSLKI